MQPIRALYDTCLPVRLDYCLSPASGSHPAPGASSTVLVPVVEGTRQKLGFLQVCASGGRRIGDRHVAAVASLLALCTPAINRAILLDRFRASGLTETLIGTSPALLKLERELKNMARLCDEPVIVGGERGTGKELVARGIHCWSQRRDRPFVPVLASALTETLVADDLFGHEKNAYTGAATSRDGRLGAAEGGSVFLDEVGDLPLAVQSALLRVLESGELSRLGRDQPLRVDVRVIAATNKDLDRLMEEGEFRRDLFDRLGSLRLEVPPLRARREDIPKLAAFFLRKSCDRFERQTLMGSEILCQQCSSDSGVRCASPEFFAALQDYDWPGNIRELKHLIISTSVRAPDGVLGVRDLPDHIRLRDSDRPNPGLQSMKLDDVVRSHIKRVLEAAGHNQSQAARILGLPLSTLRHRMKMLGMPPKPQGDSEP